MNKIRREQLMNTDVLDSLTEVLDALEELPGAIRGAI